MAIAARKTEPLASAGPMSAPGRRQARGHAAPPTPPVELGALNQHLGYFIRRAQVWVFADIIRALKNLQISPAQYSVLTVIDANPGLSQAALARTLGIERARVVRVLHRLERRGLTRRLPSSEDGRRHALRLTSKGQEMLRRAQQAAAQHETRLIERLGAEPYKTVRKILQKFQAMP